MPTMPPTFRPKHLPTRQEQVKRIDHERGSARARGYDSKWDKARLAHLAVHPVCLYCELNDGIVTAADTVDHFWGRGEGNAWFWVRAWWVSSCAPCHNGFKQQVERAGRAALTVLAGRLGLTTPG